jgi:hypothetical protein
MKRLFLLIGILSIFFLAGVGQTVRAVGPVPAETKIDYALPYPGVLPDHPLYFLKRVRDAILEVLIMEPVRKSEFYILQGDKRLEMGVMLVEQKKFALAETTVSKAEKYMEKAVVGLTTYKTNGGVVAPYVIEHAQKAVAKHMEVLGELLVQVPDAQKNGMTSSIELTTKVQQEAKALQ